MFSGEEDNEVLDVSSGVGGLVIEVKGVRPEVLTEGGLEDGRGVGWVVSRGNRGGSFIGSEEWEDGPDVHETCTDQGSFLVFVVIGQS